MDVFLISPPTQLPALLIELLLAATNQPGTFVNITRDTTESDLKQRREMRASQTVWQDGPVVTAALQGHCLILDGIERAERNASIY